MKQLLLSVSLIAISFCSFGQKSANKWYFGSNAALDFNSGAPVAIAGSIMSTNEGCASIADKTTGQTLFYTDGSSAWTRNNTLMPGGSGGMGGNASSTQSAVIVPKPGSSSIYYVFTVDAQVGIYTFNLGRFNYNVVDMTLNGGLGDVSLKNQMLMTGMTEKIAATRHCNGKDIWVIGHQWNTDAFYSYLVSSTGIAAPVISNSGIVHKNNGSVNNAESIGYMKVSPDGTQLALACDWNLHTVQAFQFDNSTGMIGSVIFTDTTFNVAVTTGGPYGVTFSPDNHLLYVSVEGGHEVYQYNLLAGNSAAILASKTQIGLVVSPQLGALQIGPNGKIYVAQTSTAYLAVINNPNTVGMGCNFVSVGPAITGTSRFGLPDMIESFIATPYDATLTYTGCSGTNTFTFHDSTITGNVSVLWNFGDPASGPADTSSSQNPSHTFSSSGPHTVTLYLTNACGTDTLTQIINTAGGFSINAGADVTLCSYDSSQLNLTGVPNGSTISWSPPTGLSCTGCPDPIANPGITTTYIVTVTDPNGCTGIDTITVNRLAPVTLTVSSANVTCNGRSDGSATVSATGSFPFTYTWSPSGGTDSVASNLSPGTYVVNVTDNKGCISSQSVTITEPPPIVLNFPRHYYICDEGGGTVTLTASGGTKYSWSPGTDLTDSTIANPVASPFATTTYTVTVTNGNCSDTAHVTVHIVTSPPPPLIVQSGDTLFVPQGYTSYQWYYEGSPIPNSNNYWIIAQLTGHYSVFLVDSASCKVLTNTVFAISSTSEELTAHEIKIYPNPATDELTISIGNSLKGKLNINITDVLGQDIYSYEETTNSSFKKTIRLDGFAKGIYFIRLQNDASKWVGKFVKE